MTSERRIFITTALFVTAAVLVFAKAGSVLLPLAAAFILAYLLDPLVRKLERRGCSRSIAIAIVFAVGSLACFAALVLTVNAFSREFSDIEINLPAYAARLYDFIPMDIKSAMGIETPALLQERITSLLDGLRNLSAGVVSDAFTIAKKAVSSTLSLLISFVGYLITPLYLFYLLRDLPKIRSGVDGLIPLRYRQLIWGMLGRIDDIISGFVRGQLMVCAILAVLYSAGLALIGIDLAILIGTVSGAAFIIPYVGTIMGIILSVIMALLKFQDVLHPLLCIGWFIVVQALEGTIITPKVVGDKVGLHPVAAIVALLIGGQLFGLVGMLVAVPAAAILKVLLGEIVIGYQDTEFFRREP